MQSLSPARDLGEDRPRQIQRTRLPSAVDDRLYYAQVREDARLEIEALRPSLRDSLVIVSSGGCTALALLAAGAGRVSSVDCNRAQNHLVELKIAALVALEHLEALSFLGASAGRPDQRVSAYKAVRPHLTTAARAYWDRPTSGLAKGALNAGVTEKFIRTVLKGLRLFVVSGSSIARLLACRSPGEQQQVFTREWKTWRWRMFFRVLLNRAVFRRTYDPSFFANVENPGFPAHFQARAEHALTKLSIAENYFLQHMLMGRYTTALPAYLTAEGAQTVASAAGRLTLIDGGMTEYLRTLPDASVTGFGLSNICEWLTPPAIEELFGQVVRTAAPGARLCFRNFVGWTEVPMRWRSLVAEDRATGERLMMNDRSAVQRRFAVCTIQPHRKMTAPASFRRPTTVREARDIDNPALRAIAAACPMNGALTLCVTREPDFFALNRLEGQRWKVGVAEVEGEVVGCVMIVERQVYLHGQAARTFYAGDLKVHPHGRGAGVADALTRWGFHGFAEMGPPTTPTLLTVLDGNRAMERRTQGSGGVPRFRRFATVRAYSIPLLWSLARRGNPDIRVTAGRESDLVEMVNLWRAVAPERQFAPVLEVDALAHWLRNAPGLSISDYRVARTKDGRIVGFVAWWDQSVFKQTRIVRYSRQLNRVRKMIHTLARFRIISPLPAEGGSLRQRVALHLCVPAQRPDILKTLLRSGCAEMRAAGYTLATIGLDVRDPLCAALKGIWAPAVLINAYVSTTGGDYLGAPLEARPLYYDLALV